jgi:uroporphyrinogen decarboxylase
LRRISTRVKEILKEKNIPIVPMTVFAKGAHYALADLMAPESHYDVLGLDWSMEFKRVKEIVNSSPGAKRPFVVVQGNLDPAVLFGTPETVRKQTKDMLREFLSDKSGKIGYICNLGHGIQPETDPENLRAFLETVRDESKVLLK